MSGPRVFERDLLVELNTALWGSVDWALMRGLIRRLTEAMGDDYVLIEVHDEDGSFSRSSVDEVEDELRAGPAPNRVEVMVGDARVFGAYIIMWTTDEPPRDDLPKPAWVVMGFNIMGNDRTRVLGTAHAIQEDLKRGVLREERPKPRIAERAPAATAEGVVPHGVAPGAAPGAAAHDEPQERRQRFWPEQTPGWIAIEVIGGVILLVVAAVWAFLF